MPFAGTASCRRAKNAKGCHLLHCVRFDGCTSDCLKDDDENGIPNVEDLYPQNHDADVAFLTDLMAQSLETGSPREFGTQDWECGRLVELSAGFLEISGPIPASIANVVELQQLRLFGNELTGLIPDSIGTLSKLTHLTLGRNQLEVLIPDSLFDLNNLRNLDLGENPDFTGPLSDRIGDLEALYFLNLNSSNFSGALPETLTQLPSLTILWLALNNFSGEIPTFLAEIDSLYSIDLFGNAFTGAIPIELGNAENLNNLDIRSNQLTGTVPEFLCDLNTVFLNDNQLCGPYPSCLTAGELGTQDESSCE